MRHIKAEVFSKKILNDTYVEVVFANKFNIQPNPGQFVHILTKATFIRRPFSIAGCTDQWVRILFKIRGPGTKKLSEVKKGMQLDIIGPLGNSFPSVDKKAKIYLVAGGIGIAPILFVAEQFVKEKRYFKLFYGARNHKDLLIQFLPDGEYIKFFTTDDGSFGKKGTVVEVFEKKSEEEKPDIVFAAGPMKMLEKLSISCKQHNIDAYISLENIMFCGLGVCQGCVIETIDGYKRVCKEGPIFNSKKIKWNLKN
ncbi:MAG: dihydroorotate dehydrogenase electron transfer subunit [Candidatus Omnitrophica bacterium]|nr:dihydroorotate dehydrogenase electron transfer subunit [Candidatus Omnitrophota bacterium]